MRGLGFRVSGFGKPSGWAGAKEQGRGGADPGNALAGSEAVEVLLARDEVGGELLVGQHVIAAPPHQRRLLDDLWRQSEDAGEESWCVSDGVEGCWIWKKPLGL